MSAATRLGAAAFPESHERAERCADAIRAAPDEALPALIELTAAAAAYMRYHAEKFYSESDVKPTGLAPHIAKARAAIEALS